MKDQTEKLIQLSSSYIYAVLGFGTEPIDFAGRLLQLREENIALSEILFDIAGRISFIDFLRFEVGWKAEGTGDIGESHRVSNNLDAIETYLLCTCIDALAGGREFTSFADWLEENPQRTLDEIGGRESITPQEYLKITYRLFDSYEKTSKGLTRDFLSFFEALPQFLQDTIVDSFILIDGDYLSEAAPKRFEKWLALSKAEKLRKIVVEYFYAIRRSKYTHASHIQEAVLPGHWRRLTESGVLSSNLFAEGWRYTRIRSAKNPDKVKYTLISHNSKDESFVLRAAILTYILTKFLKYSMSDEYLEKLLRHYRAVSAVFAFLNEMECNREHLDYLTYTQANVNNNEYQYLGVPVFSISSGEMLLENFDDVVDFLKQDIQHYLHWVKKLNERIEAFNAASDVRKADWNKRQNDLTEFSLGLTSSHEVDRFNWYHKWVYSNLKRHIKKGQIHYRYRGIICSQSHPA